MQQRRRRTWLVVALGASLALVTGCPDGDDPPADGDADGDSDTDADADEPDGSVSDCVDDDGDGFGEGCALGPDCDDGDPSRGAVDEGCDCAPGSESALCRSVEPDGTTGLCEAGTLSCSDGSYGACESLEPYPPACAEWAGGSGARRQPILGFAEPCCGSCDLGCTTVHDCPAGRDLSRDNSINLMYDPMNVPPAVILEDVDSDGRWRRVLEASCSGPIAWWAMDWNLEAESPAAVTIRARAAPSEAALAALGEEGGFHLVATCPGEGCGDRPRPDDRLVDGGGNLFAAFESTAEAEGRWLEYEISLSAGGGGASPRFINIDVYYICGDAG